MGYQSINEKDNFGFTLMHHCACTGLLDVALFLIKNGGDVTIANNLNQNCLLLTIQHGHLEMFKLFLDLGCDYHGKDNYEFTSLLYAVQSNQNVLFAYLVALGVDINVFKFFYIIIF